MAQKKIVLLFMLSSLSIALQGILPVHEIREAQIQKIRKQLVTQSQRSSKILPYALVAGAGILGYMFFDGQEKAEKAGDIFKRDFGALSADQQKLLINYAYSKRDDEKKKEEEKAKVADTRSWSKWFLDWGKEAVTDAGKRIKDNTGYLLGWAAIWQIKDQAGKYMKIAGSYLPPVIERVTDHLNPNPSFNWYKEAKSKYDHSLRDLLKYLTIWSAPFEIPELEGKLEQFMGFLTSAKSDDDREMIMQQAAPLQARLLELQELQRHYPLTNSQLALRINLELNYFLQEIERLLGFLAFADRKIVYSNDMHAREKLELRLLLSELCKTIKTLAVQLGKTVDTGIKEERSERSLLFRKEIENIIARLQQEFEGFSKIEQRILW